MTGQFGFLNTKLVNGDSGLPGGTGRRARLKIVYPYGCESSILSEATNLYRLVILNPKDETTEATLKGFAGSWLNIRYKDRQDLGARLKNDRLLESDVFFLKRYLKDLFIMAKYDFKFIRSGQA